MFDIAARLSLFSAKIKTREMLKTSKKAAPPVFRKVAWGRGLVGDPWLCAASGSRYALGPFSTLDTAQHLYCDRGLVDGDNKQVDLIYGAAIATAVLHASLTPK